MIIDTDAFIEAICNQMRAYDFTDPRVDLIQYRPVGQVFDVDVWADDCGDRVFKTFSGDDLAEILKKIADQGSAERRQLNRMCEALARVEGMSKHVTSLRIQAIMGDILKALEESRKMISDMR